TPNAFSGLTWRSTRGESWNEEPLRRPGPVVPHLLRARPVVHRHAVAHLRRACAYSGWLGHLEIGPSGGVRASSAGPGLFYPTPAVAGLANRFQQTPGRLERSFAPSPVDVGSSRSERSCLAYPPHESAARGRLGRIIVDHGPVPVFGRGGQPDAVPVCILAGRDCSLL